MSFARSPAPCETEGRGTTVAVVCLVLLVLLLGGALAFLLWRYSHITKGKSHFRLRCLLWREDGEGEEADKKGKGYKMKNPPARGLTHMRHDRSRVCVLTKQLSRSTRACSRFCQPAFDLNWGTWFSFQATEAQQQRRAAAWTLGWHHLKRKEERRKGPGRLLCAWTGDKKPRKPSLVWAAWLYTLHRNNVKSEPLAVRKNKYLPNGYSAPRASKVFALPHACRTAPDIV